jgi:hypothetical protein
MGAVFPAMGRGQPRTLSRRDLTVSSELKGQGPGDSLTVGLDVSEGEFGIETVFELRDPALGTVHPSGDVLLGKPGAKPLADESRDDLGPFTGGADAKGGLG